MPFLANEGMALDWIGDYAKFDNIVIGVNAPRALDEVRDYIKSSTRLPDCKINEKIIENLRHGSYITTTTSIFADEIKKINKRIKVQKGGIKISKKEKNFV